jgi:hypothetical protein
MATTIFERIDLIVSVAYDDHRHVTHEGSIVIAGGWDLGFKAQVAPVVAAKNPALLLRVDVRIPIDRERDAGHAVRDPLNRRGGSVHVGSYGEDAWRWD